MLKLIAAAVASLLLAAPTLCLAQYAPKAPAQASPDLTPENACTSTGGVVQNRIPEYGTNGSNPLILGLSKKFCQYLSDDGFSQIDVQLQTLHTKMPTLAALAYYAEEKVNLKNCKGGPGSCYCSKVGGTDEFGGITIAGGGWVLDTDPTDVLDVCVFPDMSAIDAYGIFYHSHDIVRGQDLHGKLRYQDPYTK